jgi:osmotically-inducible protein OsmY
MKKTLALWMLFAAVTFAIGGCGGTSKQASAGEVIDDAVITTKVKSAFVSDKKVSASNISVSTDRGVVTLTGTAKDRQESRKAAELAQQVAGVKAVDNRISVQ